MIIGKFWKDLRVSYLNDPNGARATDGVLRPIFEDELMTMYAKHGRAFYAKYSSADLDALANMDLAAMKAVNLATIISRNYFKLLRLNVVRAYQGTYQRGEQRDTQVADSQAATALPSGGGV